MTFRTPVGYNPLELPGQIVDEGSLGRIVDPISGTTLFNPNSDPNEAGIDPVTGEEYLAGTDQGFGLVIWDGIQSGVYNGGFDTGPPEGEGSQIEEIYNEVPYWRYVQDDSGHIRAAWVTDSGSSSGYGIEWRVETAVTGDMAYFEQIMPVNRSDTVKAPQFTSGAASATTTALLSWAEYQPLDVQGNEVGTPWTIDDGDDTWRTSGTTESAIVGLPATARFMRTRVGVKAVANSSSGPWTRTLRQVWAGTPLTVDLTITGSDTSLPATGTQAFFLDGGNINGRPDQSTLRLIAPSRGWVSALSARAEDYVRGGDIKVTVRNVDETANVGPDADMTAGHREARATAVYDAATNSISPGDAIRFQTAVTSGTVTSTGYDIHAIAVLTFIVPQATAGTDAAG